MMRAPALLTATALVTLSVAGCSPESAMNFVSEAGIAADEGGFGNPTMHNMMIMTGERDAVIDLTRRFASDVPATINFEFNSAVLDGAAQNALRQQAQWIAQYPYVTFRVYGHTDAVGSNAYNKNLGLRRANAAVSFLTQMGISRSRLEAVVSYGETRPLVITSEPERANRRTVTEVSGFLKSRPQTLDGKYAKAVYDGYVDSAVEAHNPEGTGNDLGALMGGGEGG